ncbi:Hypothetical protein A7982_08414 [Minicystis rosea]|nr:Hypothetical protein A7982_08414 [Minicystis rosea]
MPRKKILFICGSINQTTQMHQIARELPEYEHFYTPYYGNADYRAVRRLGLLEFTIGGHKLRKRCLDYLEQHRLPIDLEGQRGGYDLVFHCSDLLWPHNIDDSKVILVQEGMTDPESVLFPLVKRLDFLPRWMAGTSATGLSHKYAKFCVASPGYKDLFASRGVDPKKMIVTGIPNFDNCRRYTKNDFPHKNFVLCCTSDVREVYWWENRKALIQQAREIAGDRQLIFKLHPNEKLPRAIDEIKRWAPEALVYPTGNAEEMVANCDELIVRYSTLAYVGLALGKKVHSLNFDVEELRRLTPLQNGNAARLIAQVGRELLGDGARARDAEISHFRATPRPTPRPEAALVA